MLVMDQVAVLVAAAAHHVPLAVDVAAYCVDVQAVQQLVAAAEARTVKATHVLVVVGIASGGASAPKSRLALVLLLLLPQSIQIQSIVQRQAGQIAICGMWRLRGRHFGGRRRRRGRSGCWRRRKTLLARRYLRYSNILVQRFGAAGAAAATVPDLLLEIIVEIVVHRSHRLLKWEIMV